jgi:putative DNA primase/helicase
MVRRTICQGEPVQIIGRARGVRRGAECPVEVLVLTDVPLALPIDVTVRAGDLAPSPTELMLAAGGIAFANPTDAATAYPDLWPSREAAKKACGRAQLGTNPNKKYL